MINTWETPPRAWGRPYTADKSGAFFGNTPTSVGKTPVWQQDLPLPWKHPHERGEDRAGMATTGKATETPPRAWGRLPGLLQLFEPSGNTPTSVGKTGRLPAKLTREAKHPHERGEDLASKVRHRPELETPPRAWGRLRGSGFHRSVEETPPRAWGRLSSTERAVSKSGNTPTSVGKT